MSQQVVTANRLRDGAVVYLAEDGTWTERIDEARIAEDAEFAQELLATGEAAQRDGLGVEPNLTKRGDGWHPQGCRETIRSKGPSVRLDLGKQAYGS